MNAGNPGAMTLFAENLIVAGSGIRVTGQFTLEAVAWIRRADKVLYGVADAIAERVVRALNPRAESLFKYYEEDKPRAQAYEDMVNAIVRSVEAGRMTVAVFYGHPGVFAYPSHESIRRTRALGFRARMLPAVSAEDCLFADLGIDPGEAGCQSYEATDFLIRERNPDTSASLILWQVGIVGHRTHRLQGYDLPAISLLIEKLLAFYPPQHSIVIYEAATVIGCEPRVTLLPLEALQPAALTMISTLYLPPARTAAFDPKFAYRVFQGVE
jgi:uncharacterized protein YabN with tetrapyrrole methylase and pyrophosphatase domain